MPKKKAKAPEDPSKVTQILLAGILLKEEPRPDVRKLERLIKVEDGTLSEFFPQRKGRKKGINTELKDQAISDSASEKEPSTIV